MKYAKPLSGVVFLASLALSGCAGTPGEAEEPVASAEQQVIGHNAIGHNAIGHNAIGHNAIGHNAIGHNAIIDNAIGHNAIGHNAILLSELSDPLARELLEYIVSCALPEGQSIQYTVDGTTYVDPGQLGVAPEWADGPCDEMCQEWVSACVFSRIDYLGVSRLISMRGNNPGLASTPAERATYTDREATYYGNLFPENQKIFACLPPGKTQIPRVCGPSVDDCGVVEVLGSCTDLCGPTRSDGSFQNCRGPSDEEHDDHDDHDCEHSHNHGNDSKVYHGSVTVFLQP